MAKDCWPPPEQGITAASATSACWQRWAGQRAPHLRCGLKRLQDYMITVAYIHQKPKGKHQVFQFSSPKNVYRCQVERVRMPSKPCADA